MSLEASRIWLAYAFGIGLALGLIDRALKTRWAAALFLSGAAATLAYAAYQAFGQSLTGPLSNLGIVFAVLAAGYAVAEAAFLIGRRMSR